MEILRLFLADPATKGRKECTELILDTQGVIGDKFHGRQADRSVLATGPVAYRMAEGEGIDLSPGDLGENILLDLDTRELGPGDRLEAGEVVLEVSRRCPICEHLAIYDPALPRLVKDVRGVYLRVIRGGKLVRGERMRLLKPEE